MPGKNDNGEVTLHAAALDSAADSPILANSFSRSVPSAGDTRQIWHAAQRDLSAQLNKREYEDWIENLSLLELDHNTARIAAPTSYACKRLESNYGEVVSRALSEVVGQTLSVEFTVDGPVQGQMFDTPSPKTELVGATRPAPLHGIKSRGPYQSANGNGNNNNNGHYGTPQNRSNNYYGGSNGYGGTRNGNGGNNFGVKNRPPRQYNRDLDGANPYAYPEEAPEIEDPTTDQSGTFFQEPNDYDAQALKHGLNPRYVFDRYIVGSSNRMAAAAGRSVAENPGNSYNPLFIYGGVGLGKTHLLHAIGHEALRLRSYLKVLYVSSEKFTNELVNCIQSNRMEEFRARYRSIDILMIDDIQFIAGKESTQEEFFHTFNTLVEANKQVVISSDRTPKSMMTLEDRLRSRFEGGLISDVSLPDYEMRLAILRGKAEHQPAPISADVMEFIAHKVPSNIRELEGALIRVVAFGFLNKMPITVELAAQALSDALQNSRKKLVTKERIIEAVSNFYNVEMKELQGRSRSADIVLPRQVAMYIIREQTDHSLVEIGQSLGGRDHTTVMHGLEKIEAAIENNSQLRQQINHIIQSVYNGDGLK